MATSNHESSSVVKMLIKIFTQLGISKTLSTDHGPDFMSESTKHLSDLFRSEHTCTSLCHCRTSGWLERYRLNLKDYPIKSIASRLTKPERVGLVRNDWLQRLNPQIRWLNAIRTSIRPKGFSTVVDFKRTRILLHLRRLRPRIITK